MREVRGPGGRVLNRPCRKSGHGRLSPGWRRYLACSAEEGVVGWVEVDPDGEEVRRAGLEAVLTLSCQRTLLGQ